MKLIRTLLLLAGLGLFACCCSTPPTYNSGTSSGVKSYPLDTCLVTDNELGSMGDPVRRVHEGQEVKFCCAPCVKKFNKDPETYLGKLP